MNWPGLKGDVKLRLDGVLRLLVPGCFPILIRGFWPAAPRQAGAPLCAIS